MFVILRGAPPGSSGVDARLLRMTHVAPRPRPKFCGAPARRSPSEHCFGALPEAKAARPSFAVLAVRGFLRTGGRSPAGEGSGFPGDVPATSWRRRSAEESSPDFPAFPAGWRKRRRRGKRCLLPGRENGRSAEDQVSRTPDNQAEASAFVRISPCAWRRAPVPWWR